MLPDLSPAHILIVVIVALVVVGPKDLPMLLRKIGQFMGKLRGMANEFRASFDEMARQSELDELRKEVEAMRAAANAATPNLGIDNQLNVDQGSYMSQWQASQEAAEAYSSPDGIKPALAAPEATVAKAPKTAKTQTSKAQTSKTQASKPKAAKSAKSAEPAAKAPAKPRAKKPKAEAGS